jgi:hypothetical protein
MLGLRENSNSVLQETDSTVDTPGLEPDQVAEGLASTPSHATVRARSEERSRERNNGWYVCWRRQRTDSSTMAMSLERSSRGTSVYVGISFLGDRLASGNGYISHIFEPAFFDSITVKVFEVKRSPGGYAIRKGAVKQARQGTRGTARSKLRTRSAFGKCRASSGSAGVSVMRMHFEAG